MNALHNGGMELSTVLAAVDAAFAVTGAGLNSWPDPHPDRLPLDDEYSRLTAPQRWRILGARADAWAGALQSLGLATWEVDADVHWIESPGPVVSRADVLTPVVPGALPLILARSELGPIDDAGVVIGVGRPAVCINWFPDCGCDACDSGSAAELAHLDEHLVAIVTGGFRRLTRRGKRHFPGWWDAVTSQITSLGEGRWSASNTGPEDDLDAILANPAGWDELRGASWLPS